MPDVKVTSSSGWELVHSVTIILANTIATVTYDGLPLDIVFKKDEAGSVRYSAAWHGSRWTLELVNFGNVLGEGMFEPIPFAVGDGREVNLSFFVQTLNVDTHSRVLTLNFFARPTNQ